MVAPDEPVEHGDVLERLSRTPGRLSGADEVALARMIEAGVLAGVLSGSSAGPVIDCVRLPGPASRDELVELERQGRVAFGLFVERNLALVGLVLRQEDPGRPPDTDLFQEGCLGLIEAVRRFDHRRGCRFATYALYGIRAQVREARTRRDGPGTLSVDRAERLRQAQATQARLRQDLGREASLAELASALGRPVDWLGALLSHRAETSLDASTAPLQIVDPAAGQAMDAVLDVDMPGAELLESLPAWERSVIALRFGFEGSRTPHSAAVTAHRLGVSVRQVRRAEEHALDLLRGRCPQQARIHLAG